MPERIKRTGRSGQGDRLAVGILVLLLSMVPGCAIPPDSADKEAVAEFNQVNDPAEPTNRAIFSFNQVLDTAVLKPAAGMYRDLLPPAVRTGVHNALDNLRSPVVLANDVLQSEGERARVTVMRFLINSTLGLGGLGDPATDMGYVHHDEDFGQTLARWGIDEGPYVMLPVFGPSNPRDVVGLVVDFIIDPFSWLVVDAGFEAATYARRSAAAIDDRAINFDTLEDIKKSSLDYYAAIRSLYRQRRTDEIGNGQTSTTMWAFCLRQTLPFSPAHKSEEISSWK